MLMDSAASFEHDLIQEEGLSLSTARQYRHDGLVIAGLLEQVAPEVRSRGEKRTARPLFSLFVVRFANLVAAPDEENPTPPSR
jgi:hypothetical protein